jgi:hypothetical protein
MANPSTSTPKTPVTFDAFMADRQAFWGSFTSATTIAAGALVVLLILMAIFLL